MDRIAFDHLELWFDQLALAAMETLGEGAPLDQFEEALAASSPWATPGAVTTVSYQSGPTGTHYELATNASLGDMLQVVAAQDVLARFAGCSLWWRKPQTAARSHVKAFRGLPDASGFAALLTGAR
jgi:type VI secretion system protein ImpM